MPVRKIVLSNSKAMQMRTTEPKLSLCVILDCQWNHRQVI